MTTFIEDVKARQILDSRGNPTVEVDVILSGGVLGRASVPSGASVGAYEALELRDKDATLYSGKGVLKAVENVNTIISFELVGLDASNQQEIDNIMLNLDGSYNKSNLGSNAILGVSMAIARACALTYKMPLYRYLGGVNATVLPVPMMNVLNGGRHADNNLVFQEFMIAPVGAKTFEDAIKMGSEVFYALKDVLKGNGHKTTVGDEGGFAPDFESDEDALKSILVSIKNAGYNTEQIKICLDIASSEFYREGKYIIDNEKSLSSAEMVDLLEDWVNKYPIISIEDGMEQNDLEGWSLLTQKLGHRCQLIGDDLFVTNTVRLADGIKRNIANSVLIKINQIGTITETLNAVNLAKESGYSTVISHRSGETEDTFIADLAVALNSGQIKTGSISRSERVAKYNQLIRIEQELGIAARYAGINAFKKWLEFPKRN